MFSCDQIWSRYSNQYHSSYFIFIYAVFIYLICSIISILLYSDNDESIDINDISISSQIFCFVLSENNHHLTSSKVIVYIWDKRCD